MGGERIEGVSVLERKALSLSAMTRYWSRRGEDFLRLKTEELLNTSMLPNIPKVWRVTSDSNSTDKGIVSIMRTMGNA